jgi:hypothetical protein
MVERPAPISLRIRSAEATSRARNLLRRLDEENLVQRRVKWQAMKALASVYKMDTVAAPKLKTMSAGDRDSWSAGYRLLTSTLLRISKRGV